MNAGPDLTAACHGPRLGSGDFLGWALDLTRDSVGGAVMFHLGAIPAKNLQILCSVELGDLSRRQNCAGLRRRGV
ncbi:unnamed protein product [Urochloa humidicola]